MSGQTIFLFEIIYFCEKANIMKAIGFTSKTSNNTIQKEDVVNLTKEELDSINNGLKNFEEGRTHSHETARKLYERYL